MTKTAETALESVDLREPSAEAMRCLSTAEARRIIRAGQYTGHTAGIAPKYLQGNLAILPADYALEFMRFCQNNPQPCPLIGVSDKGDPMMRTLGDDIDIRTDVPLYRIWRYGELVAETTDIRANWHSNLVAFVIGCSFSFEEALLENGISLRHIERGQNVPMYCTSIETVPAGRLHGPLVVSMRPLKPADAIRAIQITSRLPRVHGAPIHFGDPRAIGIADLGQPDYGEPCEILAGEVPVFWACGVTPQAVVRSARLPFCITHAPGCMLITDRLNSELAVP